MRTELELIRLAQDGDGDSISAIYEKYHLDIYRFLYYRVGEVHTAEDLTSEVFLRMIRSISQYQEQSMSFQAWLFQIARNLSIDYYRKQAHQNQVELDENLVSNEEALDTAVERKLDRQTLQKALSKLPEDQRDVVVLRFIVGMPIHETALTLHKSEDSIKGLQRRGLIALRETLQNWEISYV